MNLMDFSPVSFVGVYSHWIVIAFRQQNEEYTAIMTISYNIFVISRNINGMVTHDNK